MTQHFLLLGDMGSGNEHQYTVAHSINELIQQFPITFVIGLGDNIYNEGCKNIHDQKFKTHFEEPYRSIPNKVKFYMCLGNHDYGLSYNPLKPSFLQNNSPVQVQYGILSQKKGKKWVEVKLRMMMKKL